LAEAEGTARPPKAREIDSRLASERLSPGRGLSRAGDRKTWRAELASLPIGTVIADGDGSPLLIAEDGLRKFGFEGWQPVIPVCNVDVEVITPPTSVSALRGGFVDRAKDHQ
jgi:hypothetical protein